MTELFITKGSEHYTAQDIYDKRGLLLLSKDKKITAEIKNRLERIADINLNKSGDVDKKQNVVFAPDERESAILTPVTQKLKKRMNIRNNRILEKPNEILINIIFHSKTKPWWIYVNALSNYVDWLYTHSIDVALISLMIAVDLGLRDEELTNLGIGALLHDVGKLLVPKSIIQKHENLTETELSLVRQHCELGMRSLESFNLPREYLDIAMQHHERLDGSGYPEGLKGYGIGRFSRIVMIADAVDTITSYKPNRQALSIGGAIKKLRDEKGKYSQGLISLLEKILQ